MQAASITNDDLVRAIDLKIAALKQAREALISAFSGDMPPRNGAAKEAHPPPHRAARGGKVLKLPAALERVMGPAFMTNADLLRAIALGMEGGTFRVRSRLTPDAVRTAMHRIYRSKGWEKGELDGDVAYRIGGQR